MATTGKCLSALFSPPVLSAVAASTGLTWLSRTATQESWFKRIEFVG